MAAKQAMNDITIWQQIAAPLDPKQIKTRQQSNATIRYIDARDVINRLNEVAPGQWEDMYRVQQRPPDGVEDGLWVVECTLTIQGVSRSDVGLAEKGTWGGAAKAAYSDALKRAAVKFGFGVELYGDDTPDPLVTDDGDLSESVEWVDNGIAKKHEDNTPYCVKHGVALTHRSGIAKSTGKPYSIFSCQHKDNGADCPSKVWESNWQTLIETHMNSPEPMNNWIEDAKLRSGFWAWTKEQGLSHDQVHSVLGVTSLKFYTGALGEAKTTLQQYADDLRRDDDPLSETGIDDDLNV